MTKEEQAVLDAALAWQNERFNTNDYRENEPFEQFKAACYALSQARLGEAGLAKARADILAYRKAVRRTHELSAQLGRGFYEILVNETEKAEEAEHKQTREQVRKYTGRGDL